MRKQPVALAIIIVLFHAVSICKAQSVIIPKEIKLPADTATKQKLVSSLNGFLKQKEKANKENSFVLQSNLLETSALLDELTGIERSAGDTTLFKPYLTNVVKLDDNNFVIQLAYMGIKSDVPVLKASYKLLAVKDDQRFYFSSPLKANTIAWKIKKFDKLTCYYKDTLTSQTAKEYQQKVYFYQDKLKAPHPNIEFYYCDNLTEALQITGVEYKADYNGLKSDCLTANQDKRILFINAWPGNGFDPHDLWHDRLRTVMKPEVINRPVDEGCAYLYGGSWGYSWHEVLARFNKYADSHPDADWLNLYINGENFVNGEKIMKISYALNALIIQKIERDRGFMPVMELLGCGKREKGDENYFKALERITGITRANFNNKVWKMIKASE